MRVVGVIRSLSPNFSRAGFAALLVGALAIGFAPIFVRWSEVGPFGTAFWRVFLAQPVLWLFVALERKQNGASGNGLKDLWPLFAAGSIFAVEICVWHTSVLHTTIANCTLLANLAPIFVTLLAWVFLRQQVTRLFLVGLAVAIIGAGFLSGGGLEVNPRGYFGDSLAILAAVLYAAYLLAVSFVRRSFSAAAVMAWAGAACSVLLLVFTLVGEDKLFPETAGGWWVAIGLALICHVVGQGLITYGLGHLPATISSVVLLLQPVLATALAWVLLGETMGATQMAGACTVLAGIHVARISHG
jgi:drug/metabolite transporter (DMT)-like permease